MCGAALPETPHVPLDEANSSRLVTEAWIPQYRPVTEYPYFLQILHHIWIQRCVVHNFVGGYATGRHAMAVTSVNKYWRTCSSGNDVHQLFPSLVTTHANCLTRPHIDIDPILTNHVAACCS